MIQEQSLDDSVSVSSLRDDRANRKPERDGARRGSANFQQKIMRDRFSHLLYFMKNLKLKLILKILIILFAIIGVVFAGVFFAIRLGLTNVRGTIAERNKYFDTETSNISNNKTNEAIVSCKVHVLASVAPDTARKIDTAFQKTGDMVLVQNMFENALLRFENTSMVTEFYKCEQVTEFKKTPIAQTAYKWADSPEWEVLKSAFIRDQDSIKKAAKDAGIPPRILLGGVIGEQLRFFGNSREAFKSYFEPLKILASLSSFSYGIAGLKPETVARIDENLKNRDSVFYLEPAMENIVTYPEGTDPASLRFERITNTKNTYYSYLYVGLFMRQVTAQWAKAGYDISNRPGVLSTLYNLGFNRSIPKANSGAGGAVVNVNGQQYSFGELGEQFYYSGELMQEFPYTAN
ncbi:MAG TPA: hypothetical protein VGO63_03920 [Candidatus Paceibacterota bacterium]|nr:hypothetical protein [Candidatus Paceibacterota bacterium]